MKKPPLQLTSAILTLGIGILLGASSYAQDDDFNSVPIQPEKIISKRKKNAIPPLDAVFSDPDILSFIQDLQSQKINAKHSLETVNHLGVDGVTPLAWLSANGDLNAVNTILSLGADPNLANNKGATPLLWASSFGFPHVVQSLVNAGAKLDVQEKTTGGTPLIWSVILNHTQVADILLTAGADPFLKNERGMSAATIAIVQKNKSLMSLFQPLINKRRSLSLVKSFRSPKLSAIAKAIINKNETALKLELAQGADINQSSQSGLTLLIVATLEKNKSAFRTLLESGADPNLFSGDRDSLILLASVFKDPYYLSNLLSYGGDPNQSAIEGITPLMRSSSRGLAKNVRLLLDNSASVSAVDKAGNTALAYAIITDFPDIVEMLLDAGADPSEPNASGETPMSIASDLGRKEILNLLNKT